MKTIAVLLVILAAGVAWCGEDLKRFDISTTTAIPVPSDLTYGPSSAFSADSKDYIPLPAPIGQHEVDALLKEMEKDAGTTFFKHSPIDEIVFTDPYRAGGGITLDDLLKAIEYGLEAMGHDPGENLPGFGYSDSLYRPIPSEIDRARAAVKSLEEKSRRIKFMREAADKLRKAIEASK